MIKELILKDLTEQSDLIIANKAAIQIPKNEELGKVTKGKKHIERKFSCRY